MKLYNLSLSYEEMYVLQSMLKLAEKQVEKSKNNFLTEDDKEIYDKATNNLSQIKDKLYNLFVEQHKNYKDSLVGSELEEYNRLVEEGKKL